MSDELFSLVSAELSADVTRLGAELVRLDDAVGDPLLWNGDPAFWSGRAPLLFPIVGALAGGTFRHHGRTHALPRHGFARRSTFTLVDRGSAHVTLRLEASAATRQNWPFDFRLDVRHALVGPRLTTTATLTNLSDEPMPAAFGFHPAFRWPLAGAGPRSHHVVRFATAEPAPVRRLDADGLLTAQPRPTPVEGDLLPLSDDLFAEDALIFDQPVSRRLTYGGGDVRLTIEFPDMPHLGLWSKPGAPFLCVEPWQGFADPAGFADEITAKPGMVILAPGATRRFEMSVTLEFEAP
ncbi:MAG: aldose 1-epimerase family protein [Phyllobacteriaceae bacterium]|nr:aldose 1-epimerase family protein [Phyllobacteriaceae bacterium]